MTEEQKRKSVERTLSGYPFPNFENLKEYNNVNYDKEFTYALNFANYTYDHATLKKYTQEFMVDMEIEGDTHKIPDWEFYHFGILAWMYLKGATLSEDIGDKLTIGIQKLIEKYDVPVVVKVSVNLKKLHADDLISDLENLMDDILYRAKYIEPIDIISQDRGAVDLDRVRMHFQAQLDEVNDPALIDSFPAKDKLLQVLGRILRALNGKDVVHAAKAPRIMKPKKIDPSKMVKNLKYLKSVELDPNTLEAFKLISIKPETIIGASVLWVYNTKTRKLGSYIAKDGTTLSVKGSTIMNYEVTSVNKMLRKPVNILSKLLTAGKVEQRKILDSVNAVASPLSGRINKDCVLAKVY
jgi:hypothetical protein